MAVEEKTCLFAPGESCPHIGLLVLRVGIGSLFMAHGIIKFLGGVEFWENVGGAIGMFGIHFAPAFWGFMAAFAEAVGGLCLVLGLFVRPAAMLMAFTMIVAATTLVKGGGGFTVSSNPIHMIAVFVALIFSGSGRYGLGKCIGALKGKWYQ
ncbi:MAG: DoxX family protein [Planctomycetota bacterium]